MIVFCLEIPILPPMTNTHMSKDWRTQAFAKKKLRDQLAIIFLGHKNRRGIKSPLKYADVILTRCSSVRPDYDGLVSSGKHILDALQQAGVLENDRHENIGVPLYRWEKAPRGKGVTRIQVTERISLVDPSEYCR